MADHTKIEWTDATWNPITGCSVATPGCTNCYAMKLAGTRMKHHPSRAKLTIDTKAGPAWNGEVRFNEEWLTQPLNWKKPRRIFVCAHADLFHESVPDAWIDRVFAVMALAPQHTFQVLTKRSKRMLDYITEHGSGFGDTISVLERVADQAGRMMEEGDNAADCVLGDPWPLPNVWLGVSVEDQKRADERIPDLLATPAAVRWISAEPLLGPLDLTQLPFEKSCDCKDHSPTFNSLDASVYCAGCCEGAEALDIGRLDWVVVGGESGPKARPSHPDWLRSLRDQCAAAGVPFFFKQWGEFREYDTGSPEVIPIIDGTDEADDMVDLAINPSWISRDGVHALTRDHLSMHVPSRMIERIGKKAAGRLLDGVEHNGYPEPR